MNLNKAVICGRLTKDPEHGELPSGVEMTKFSLATNIYYTNKAGEKHNAVEYHNIVAFGKVAGSAGKFLTQGQLALVEGRLQTSSWDRADGTKGYRTSIIADAIQFGPKAGTLPNAQNSPVGDNFGIDDPKSVTEVKPQAGKKQGGKKAPVKVEYPTEEIDPNDIPW